VEVGEGFFNIRASFKFLGNFVDIGTHMSLLRLESGKFLVIDTVPLDDALKQEIDNLTENGDLIEAVIATHPFHTLAFPAFYEAYPDVPYYGTPRHIGKFHDIPWVGKINDEENLTKWEPDVYMRIPAGAEFVEPLPESSNHFSCVWVFHPASRTIHIDDTVMCYTNMSGIVGFVASLARKKGTFDFHPSIKGPGLYPTAEAPMQFKAWIEEVLNDWDFDNVCCAHLGNKIGGAHQILAETLANNENFLKKLADKYTVDDEEDEVKKCPEKPDDGDGDSEEVEKYNVEGCECG